MVDAAATVSDRPPAAAVPELPLLAPWYRIVEDGERLVLEHGHRVVALEGAAATTLLPRLLPLLDGQRSVPEIVATVGVAVEPAVRNALDLLARNGLLASGPPPECAGEARATVEQLAAGAALPPATVAARVAEASVAIVGGAAAAGEVARLLRRGGIGDVRRAHWDDAAVDAELAVVAPTPDEAVALAAWNERALSAGLPWLQVLPDDGRFLAIGPLFIPGETACQHCYRLRRAASLGIGPLSDALETVPVRAGSSPAATVAAAAVAAAHVLRWLGTGDPALPGVLFALEWRNGLALHGHLVLRVPRCPACSVRRWSAAPLPWFHGGSVQPDSLEECA